MLLVLFVSNPLRQWAFRSHSAFIPFLLGLATRFLRRPLSLFEGLTGSLSLVQPGFYFSLLAAVILLLCL